MAFFSNLFGSKLMDDDALSMAKFISANGEFGGYIPRDFSEVPFASTVEGVGDSELIPRDEWDERIEEEERTESSLRHLQMYLKIPTLNQKTAPYCWCYGPTKGIMYAYGSAGYDVPHLSATSLAAKITNYVARGWWAEKAITESKRFGISTLEFWPDAAIDRRYDTSEQRANAALHKAVEYRELPSRSFDHMVSSLFRKKPVTMGLDWMGHLMLGVRVVKLKNGGYGIDTDNSWGSDWGNNGAGIFSESKATAFEQFEIRTVKLGGQS